MSPRARPRRIRPSVGLGFHDGFIFDQQGTPCRVLTSCLAMVADTIMATVRATEPLFSPGASCVITIAVLPWSNSSW